MAPTSSHDDGSFDGQSDTGDLVRVGEVGASTRQRNGLVDTQLLLAALQQSASAESLPSTTIASPTAKELLLAQSLNSKKPLYYVLHPVIYDHLADAGEFTDFGRFRNPRWAKQRHQRTDAISFYLGNQYPAYREYGDQALALLINNKNERVFQLSIAHLPKDRQKSLMKRWRYLVENDFFCLPLNSATVKIGLDLLSQFVETHSPKTNIANTVLDMMIFATAVQNQLKLHTLDRLLASFVCESYALPGNQQGDSIVVDFSTTDIVQRSRSTESKGYINRGWSYSIRSQHNVGGR